MKDASRPLNRLIGIVAEWKRDSMITASWLNVPLIYLSSATLIYQNIPRLKTLFPSYPLYLITAMAFFAFFYWAMAKVILRFELYSAEVIYGQKINPYAFTEFTPKERTIIEMSVLHTEGVIQIVQALSPENKLLIKALQQSKAAVEKLLDGEDEDE